MPSNNISPKFDIKAWIFKQHVLCLCVCTIHSSRHTGLVEKSYFWRSEGDRERKLWLTQRMWDLEKRENGAELSLHFLATSSTYFYHRYQEMEMHTNTKHTDTRAHTHTVIPILLALCYCQTTEPWTFPSAPVQDISGLQWIPVCLITH